MILTRNILYTALAIYLLASVAFAEKTDAPEAAIIVPVEQTNPVALHGQLVQTLQRGVAVLFNSVY